MNEIIECLSEFLGIEKDEIHENSDLANDLGLTSFDLMELSCELEEKFQIKIVAENLVNVKYVYDLKPLLECGRQAV